MRRMMYAATMTLACLSTISVGLAAGTSLHLKASAAEGTCELSSNPAVTGGEIQKRIDDVARCNSSHRPQQMVEESHNIKTISPQKVNVNPVNPRRNSVSYPAYCGSLPQGATVGDAFYNAFLYRCQYGD